ncbi:hypothetical protein C8R44DRAFT_976041 [Mycena epipterygia]|nr:hypothetical protein C8R44DRAFT_976041 [Mycena epipterygia]
MREFPQELVDEVIDDVAATANTKTIATCGGVCRRWVPRSRKHLFSHITFSNTDPATIQSFVDMVEGSSVPILSFIRSLDLCVVNRQVSDVHMLARKLQNWPSLAELCTHPTKATTRAEISQFHPALHRHYIPRFGVDWPALTRLELVFASHMPLGIITDIASTLPFLTHLRLCGGDNYGVVHYAPSPPTAVCPPRLHTMDLSLRRGTGALFEWLLSQDEPPNITSLSLAGPASDEPTAPIDAYLQRFGPKILSLSLAYYWVKDGFKTQAFETRALGYVPRLVHLALGRQYATRLLTILALLSPVHLATLEIEVRPVVTARNRPNWAQIDTIVGTPPFGALRRLAFTHQITKNSVITRAVKELMPQASARNILVETPMITPCHIFDPL